MVAVTKVAARVPAPAEGAGSPETVRQDGEKKAAAAGATVGPRLVPLPFTINQVREAIPAHCFERSVATSFAYLVRDIVFVAALATAARQIEALPGAPLRALAWVLYWIAQGTVLSGVWVIAHECGHQAFSPYKKLNDAVGWVLHSALLVPYHSWRITHGMHHKHTNHLHEDQVFVPVTKESLGERWKDALEESPFGSFIGLFVMLSLGWPTYLLFNIAGQNYGRRTNHFEPTSPQFLPEHRQDVLWSDVGVTLCLAVLAGWTYVSGFSTVAFYYGVPYLICNFWLVLITFLQHTDRRLSHYRGKEFSFLRGALSTVDRSFGWVLNEVQHYIQDTHVCHHLFSVIPHYHAKEASAAVRRVLGDHYIRDDTFFMVAMYRSWRECRFVEGSGDCLRWQTDTCDSFDAKAQ